MLRLHMRMVVIALAFFAGMLMLFRAQHYDEQERREWFVGDGCSAACFVGIRAGQTRVDEAVKLLEASEWIDVVDNRTINNVSGFISWTWSAQKPSWIDGRRDGRIWASQEQVVTITVYTVLGVGDSHLALGAPDQGSIDRTADRKGIMSLYSEFYGRLGLIVQSWQPCRVLEPLRPQIFLTYFNQADPSLFPEADSLSDLRHTCAIPRS